MLAVIDAARHIRLGAVVRIRGNRDDSRIAVHINPAKVPEFIATQPRADQEAEVGPVEIQEVGLYGAESPLETKQKIVRIVQA
jgi:hypothetical protein